MPVSGSIDNRETTSLDLVFIIVPAVVGAAVIAAVIIGVVAIRRRGEFLASMYIRFVSGSDLLLKVFICALNDWSCHMRIPLSLELNLRVF